MILANSHVHANGMVTNNDILGLANKYRIDLTAPPKLRPATSCIGPDGSRDWTNGHHSMLHTAYDQSVSLIREPEDLYKVILGGLWRDAAKGAIYARVLSSGLNNCRNPAEAKEVFTKNALAITAAMREAQSQGIYSVWSVSIKRHLKNAAQKAHELLDCVEAFQKKHPDESSLVTSLDMAGDETKTPFAEFYGVFERASLPDRKGGLGLQGSSTHCGEVEGVHDIRAAIKLKGIKQISHALSAIDDPTLIDEIRDRNILVDQLQINNEMLQPDRFGDVANHPLKAFYAAGIAIALGSDDPGLQNTNIADEYAAACIKGLNNTALLGFTSNAIRFSFIPALEIKTELLRQVANYAREWGIAMHPDMNKVPSGSGKLVTVEL